MDDPFVLLGGLGVCDRNELIQLWREEEQIHRFNLLLHRHLDHAAASTLTSTTHTTGTEGMTITVVRASRPVPPATCPNYSPFVRDGLMCPRNIHPSDLLRRQPPLFMSIQQSTQGLFGLFSFKHVVLAGMPFIKDWMKKFGTVIPLPAQFLSTSSSSSSRRGDGFDSILGQQNDEEEQKSTSALPALLDHHAPIDEPIPISSSSTSSSAEMKSLDSTSSIPTSVHTSSSSSLNRSATSSSSSTVSLPLTSSASSSSVSSTSAAARQHHALLHQLYLNSSSDMIAKLGKNTLEHTLSFMSARELALLMSISKTWYRSANANHLWMALNKKEILPKLVEKDSSMRLVISGLALEFELKRQASSSASSTSPANSLISVTSPESRANAAANLSKFRALWEGVLRQHQQKLRLAILKIGNLWHMRLLEERMNQLLSVQKELTGTNTVLPIHHGLLNQEQEYLEATHSMTEEIQKINTHLAYMKSAEKQARQCLAIATNSAADELEETEFTSSETYAATSVLVLCSCALVQAVHRHCSGTAAKPFNRPRPSAASSTSSSITESKESLDSPDDSSSSMSNDLTVLNQVLQDQLPRPGSTSSLPFIDDENDHHDAALPETPQLTSSLSYSSTSSTSSSSTGPSLQRSVSLPDSSTLSSSTSSSTSSSNNRLHPFLSSSSSRVSEYQTISDVLLVMERTCPLVNFEINIAQTIQVYEQKPSVKKGTTNQDHEEVKTNTGIPIDTSSSSTISSSSSVSTSSGSIDDFIATGAALNKTIDNHLTAGGVNDDPAGDSDDDDDDSDSDSEFDPNEMDQPPNDLDAHLPNPNGDQVDEPPPPLVEEGEQLLPAIPPAQPAIAAPLAQPAVPLPITKSRKAQFAADIDELGNLFLIAKEIPESITTDATATSGAAASASSSSSSNSGGANSTSTAATISTVASSSSTSSAPDSSNALPTESPRMIAATSYSQSSQLMSIEQSQVLDSEWEAAQKKKSTEAKPKPIKKVDGSAKLAFKESMEFLKVQQGIDNTRRDETNIQRSQVRTLRQYALLRNVFQGLIFASMLWNIKEYGIPQFIFRVACIILLVISIMKILIHEYEIFGPPAPAPVFEQAPAPGQANDPGHHPLHIAMVLDVINMVGFGPGPDDVLVPNANPENLNNDPLNPNAEPPLPLAELRRRKRWRRLLMFTVAVVLIESYRWYFNISNPPAFNAFCLILFRLSPCLMILGQAYMLAFTPTTWRHRGLQVWFVSTLLLEGLFWSFDFQNAVMREVIEFHRVSVLPKLLVLGSIFIRILPISAMIVCFIELIIRLCVVLIPLIIVDNGNFIHMNPQLTWTQLYHTLRDHASLRKSYIQLGVTTMIALIAETIFTWLGFEVPFVSSALTKLYSILPFLGSLAYEIMLMEGRGIVLGLALLRFVFVVDQSLPIHALQIKKRKPQTKLKSLVEKHSSSSSTSTSTADQPSPKPASPATTSPRVVCLSCQRQHLPFRPIRWLNDLIFETHLLIAYPFSGVQGILIQKKEQELQLCDRRKWTAQLTDSQSAGIVKEEVEDEDVHYSTCYDCTLHSVRMQLILPFFYFGVSFLLMSRIFPAPMFSNYHDLISTLLRFFLDRVPLLVICDIIFGWWQGRVLNYPRVYYALSGILVAYGVGVSIYFWYVQATHWYQFAGFLFSYTMLDTPSSSLILDVAWLIIWVMN